MTHSLPALARTVAFYVACVAVALGLTAALVASVGHSPWSVLDALVRGSVASPGTLGRTTDATVPVLLVALGTLVAVRGGMFNIGQTGQLVIGGVAATAVAVKLPGPGPVVLVAAIAASAVGGALWAGIASGLHAWRRINVVVSTLLLTYVATQVLGYVVSSPRLLQAPARGSLALPESPLVPAAARLPHPGGYPSFGVTSGLFVAALLLAVVWVALDRSGWGLRLRAAGANPAAARRLGVRVALVAAGALLVSGALAGLAGGVMATGTVYRVQAGFANTFGNDGLLAALVCRDRPGWLLPVSFAFGMIRTGGSYFLSTGVPSYLAQVLQALLVLAVVFPPVFNDRRQWGARLGLGSRGGAPILADGMAAGEVAR